MKRCHSCLKDTNESFCRSCLIKLFVGKKVNHVLSFTRPEFNEIRLEKSDRLSISGVQIKYSLKLEKNNLILTEQNGEFIIKPIPYGSFNDMENIPANEHLTMQIAKQIFRINIPANAIIFFSNNEPAFIVKRFDLMPDGRKLLQEDFAQIANKSEDTDGENYKYDLSYEEIGELVRKYVSAYSIEIEKYFSLVVFNYLTGNGDAHLKNFSLFRNEKFGDYIFTPAHDLLNTNIHFPHESDMALELFKDSFVSDSFIAGSKYTREDFIELGNRFNIRPARISKILNKFASYETEINRLIQKSFLASNLKQKYIDILNLRRDRIKN